MDGCHLLSPVSAGFPSPAANWSERPLDLNDLLVPHPASTFFVGVQGNSMINAGIHDGDILVVDRLLEALHKNIVVVSLRDALMVKYILFLRNTIVLQSAHHAYPSFAVTPSMNFQVWGVVTCVLHPLHAALAFAAVPDLVGRSEQL